MFKPSLADGDAGLHRRRVATLSTRASFDDVLLFLPDLRDRT